MNNNERYDLSNRLIHFFRDVERIDLDKLPSFIENPTTFENQKKDAFFFLEQSIRYKLLPTTWVTTRKFRKLYLWKYSRNMFYRNANTCVY